MRPYLNEQKSKKSPVLLAHANNQEAEIRRIKVQTQPAGQMVPETLS
jgi:hypothetical protein